MLLEDMTLLPKPNNPNQIDPALLTFNEFADLVNAHKSHPSSAYDWPVERMNEFGGDKSKYTKLIQRIRRHGLDFELRMRTEKCRYAKRLPDNSDYVRDENNGLIYYTDEEAARLGRRLEEYSFAIFNDKDQRVAILDDEWGCVLVAVAQEFRSFGFGAILSKVSYLIEPGKTTGGTTSSGFQALRKTHREFVGDALRNGHYRSLINQGQVTYARVKEIVESAGLPRAPSKREEKNLSSSNPRDWLLFADGNGCFVLYDKKLKDLFKAGDKYEYWHEDFIKGIIYVSPGPRYGIIFQYGGETKGIRSFLLRCAESFCEKEGCVLVVDDEDKDDIDERFLQMTSRNLNSGFWRYEVKRVGEAPDIGDWIRLEDLTRRSFDRHDEFKHFMWELAESKYRKDNS